MFYVGFKFFFMLLVNIFSPTLGYFGPIPRDARYMLGSPRTSPKLTRQPYTGKRWGRKNIFTMRWKVLEEILGPIFLHATCTRQGKNIFSGLLGQCTILRVAKGFSGRNHQIFLGRRRRYFTEHQENFRIFLEVNLSDFDTTRRGGWQVWEGHGGGRVTWA